MFHGSFQDWHELDVVNTRRRNNKSVFLTPSYYSEDCDTNHLLVCYRIKLEVREGKPDINSNTTARSELLQLVTDTLEKKTLLSPEDAGAKLT